MQYSAQLYGKLEAETGQASEWKPVGSLRLASSEERWSELKRMATTARSFDFELHTLSPKEAQEQVPADHARRRRRRGVRRPPTATVDPSSLTMAYAKGARAGGVRIVEGVLVTGDRGRGPARHARAAPTRAPSTARSSSTPPASGRATWQDGGRASCRPARSSTSTSITEKSDAIPAGLPTLRDPDNIFYLKPEPGALRDRRLGKGHADLRRRPACPSGFGRELFQPNQERLEAFVLPAAERLPILNEIGIRTVINGPIPISPDGEPIMGLAPELDNFYVACGFTSGIAASRRRRQGDGGMDRRGRARARPLGLRRAPLRPPSRMSARYLAERTRRQLLALLPDPLSDRGAALGARRPALAALSSSWRPRTRCSARASAGSGRTGSRRPGSEAIDQPSFEGRPNWFGPVGDECRAARERAVLIDQSSFSKYEIAGPGALRRPAAARRQRPRQAARARWSTPSSATSAAASRPISPSRGSTRTASTSSPAAASACATWAGSRSTCRRDGSVACRTSPRRRAAINLAGPRSRDVLRQVADGDVEQRGLSLHDGARAAHRLRAGAGAARHLSGRARLRAAPADRVCRRMSTSCYGQRAAISASPMPATAPSNSLRLEKRYLYWGADITPDYTPYEAGLGFAVVAEEGIRLHRPRRAGEGQERRPAAQADRASWSTSRRAALWRRGDPADGKVLGVTSSGGWGHTIGKSIVFGYVPGRARPATTTTRSRPSAAACRRGDRQGRRTIRSGARFSCEAKRLSAPRPRLPILTEPAASSS